MAQIKLYLFGPPRLERQGRPISINLRKALALLIYLAVTRQLHSRDALATLFWPEKDQQGARANLRRTLYDLGQLLDAQLLAITPETVTLSPTAPLWLDVERFQQALADHLPATLLTAGVAVEALAALVEAADYYSDDFLAGFTLPDAPAFDDWQFFQREELRGVFARLLQQVIATYVAQAKFEEAVRYARRWLLLDPLEEAVHRQLMQLYAQAGQQAAAVRQYDECVRILAAELDVPPEVETTALYEAIRTRRFPAADKVTRWQGDKVTSDKVTLADSVTPSPPHLVTLSPPHPVTTTPPHNLPTQNTPFVGRQQEVAELIHRLADPACRLLTIVGPGGIGKTRLAMAAVQQMMQTVTAAQQFKDGLFFVPLQPVNAPSGVIPAIADALGFHFYGGSSPQEQLFSFLREKQMLLLLDNFEHLLAATDLVAALLAAAPGVKVLVTAREALKLQEEWFHPLSGLRLPPQAQPTTRHSDETTGVEAAILERYDAVQLFVQTARRAVVDFDPDQHQVAIVRICRLVDGMPLALELAASWLKVLSCEQIADEIARGGKILVTRHQNVPARHRNMRVVMEQSWQLLDEPTQQVLSRLSVFQGGFDQAAALAVADADLLTLAELVDKAWVYHTAGNRYQMHELLRQFAAEKLAEADADRTETEARHTTFYLQQVAQREQALLGPAQRAALDAINAEIDNVQAAWLSGADRHHCHLVAEALHALYLFFLTRSRYAEGEALFIHALHQLDLIIKDDSQPAYSSPERFRPIGPAGDVVQNFSGNLYGQLRGRLLARLGGFRHYQGDLAAADSYCETALATNLDRREQAFICELLGKTARVRGDRPVAEARLHQSLTLGRELNDQNQMAGALHGLADTVASFGAFAESEQYAREALRLCQQFQRPDLTARVLAALAWAVSVRGGYREAEQYYHESLLISQKISNPYGIALATNFLGWMAFCEGGARLPEAINLYEQALRIWRQIGQRSNLAMCLGDYALALYEAGDYAAALRSAQEGLAITEKLNHLNLTAYNLNALGAAACGLDDLAASRRYLLRSLQLTIKAQIPDSASVTLYLIALLLIKEGNLTGLPVAERLQNMMQALELLTVVIYHLPTWQLFRDRAQRVETELMTMLTAAGSVAVTERRQSRSFDAIATALLQEWQTG